MGKIKKVEVVALPCRASELESRLLMLCNANGWWQCTVGAEVMDDNCGRLVAEVEE